ncbi:MAG: amino acid adenylation domain-containing protein, partial [Legionellaceae bacterium]|nr:amino acid adenylation domain-containing protein [Legionellaceae bacterium]
YVPIDPTYPVERIGFILEDTKVQLVLSQRQYGHLFKDVLLLDEQTYMSASSAPLTGYRSARDLAYVIYTSGTTGQPKGVMIEHRSVNRLVCSPSYIEISSKDRIGQTSNVAFDAATFEIWGALLNGASLVLVPAEEMLDTEAFGSFLVRESITILSLVGSFFHAIAATSPEILKGLDDLIVGGEVVSPLAIRQLEARAASPRAIIQMYGPTESTTFALACLVESGECMTLPIGKAIGNTTAYVLNSDLTSVPIGVLGELYLGGDGLARGYLNRTELTAERFIKNPFGGGRLYKTGDIVRWLEDGNLEYVGRNDFQVKIRGYRIELGEIEHVLCSYPGISQGVVICDEKEGNKHLLGYYVGTEVEEDVLKTHMSRHLPEYMLPTALVRLDTLPLTENGKLDRQGLPSVVFGGDVGGYVAPRTMLERHFCRIWEESLGVSRVGIEDNFFKLGGHSILAIQVVVRMNAFLEKQGYYLTVADIFSYSCIKYYTWAFLKTRRGASIVRLMRDNKKLDKRIYFIHTAFGGYETFQPFAKTMASQYCSIGIDNSYVYSDIVKESISALAQYYLDEISLVYPFVQNHIVLFASCFGGKIALEMAYQLEQQGFQNIKVFLLNTHLRDDVLLRNPGYQAQVQQLTEERKLQKRTELEQQGMLDSTYITQVMKAMDIVAGYEQDPISGMLLSTKVILLKFKSNNLEDNIQKVVKNPIHIVNLNCYYDNLHEQEKEISDAILKYDCAYAHDITHEEVI